MSEHNAMTVSFFVKDGRWMYRCDSNGGGYSGWRAFHPDESPVEDPRLLRHMMNAMMEEASRSYGWTPKPPRLAEAP